MLRIEWANNAIIRAVLVVLVVLQGDFCDCWGEGAGVFKEVLYMSGTHTVSAVSYFVNRDYLIECILFNGSTHVPFV